MSTHDTFPGAPDNQEPTRTTEQRTPGGDLPDGKASPGPLPEPPVNVGRGSSTGKLVDARTAVPAKAGAPVTTGGGLFHRAARWVAHIADEAAWSMKWGWDWEGVRLGAICDVHRWRNRRTGEHRPQVIWRDEDTTP